MKPSRVGHCRVCKDACEFWLTQIPAPARTPHRTTWVEICSSRLCLMAIRWLLLQEQAGLDVLLPTGAARRYWRVAVALEVRRCRREQEAMRTAIAG